MSWPPASLSSAQGRQRPWAPTSPSGSPTTSRCTSRPRPSRSSSPTGSPSTCSRSAPWRSCCCRLALRPGTSTSATRCSMAHHGYALDAAVDGLPSELGTFVACATDPVPARRAPIRELLELLDDALDALTAPDTAGDRGRRRRRSRRRTSGRRARRRLGGAAPPGQRIHGRRAACAPGRAATNPKC